MADLSLLEYLNRQLNGLSEIVGTDSLTARTLLTDLLGPTGARSLSQPPAWPSNVADDHTPVEFSIAFNDNEPPALRILGDALSTHPSAATNLSAAHTFLRTQAARFGLALSAFERVRDLFATDHPQGEFALWHSMVLRRGRRPEFKVYFNPELRGVDRAPDLVARAMDRLGLSGPWRTALRHGVRPGELGRADRLTFFALDLHDGPHARVKLYLTHHGARATDLVRAAEPVSGIDTDDLVEFCEIAGGRDGTFDALPLVGSYTFLGDADRPSGYSVYVPVRGYVGDDDEAYGRARLLLERYGFRVADLDRAIAAVTDRPLRDGVGLIAHTSLRLGPPRPGVTVYLSAEAYRVHPPRPRRQPADREHVPPKADCYAG
jgi:DMATS type aromatic prenyltransferase